MNNLRIAVALCVGLGMGSAYAKLPPAPSLSDEQKADVAAKTKAAADKEAELTAKYQDRTVANYRKNKGIAEPKVAAAPKAPAVGPKK